MMDVALPFFCRNCDIWKIHKTGGGVVNEAINGSLVYVLLFL